MGHVHSGLSEMRRLVGERDERAVRAAAVGLAERVYNQITALRTLADRVSDGVPFQQLAPELFEVVLFESQINSVSHLFTVSFARKIEKLLSSP